MRPTANGVRDHEAAGPLPHDHHSAPSMVEFDNTTQSLPPGTTWDLDVTLPNANFKLATIQLMGPAPAGGMTGSSHWHEHASVHATTNTGEGVGHTTRSAGIFKKVYCTTYAKSAGDANLTHKIFDSVTATGSRYIALQDAWITGSILRLRFRNFFGGSATLWVKGSALLW
jgi:hypothetical protein